MSDQKEGKKEKYRVQRTVRMIAASEPDDWNSSTWWHVHIECKDDTVWPNAIQQ